MPQQMSASDLDIPPDQPGTVEIGEGHQTNRSYLWSLIRSEEQCKQPSMQQEPVNVGRRAICDAAVIVCTRGCAFGQMKGSA